MATSGGTFFSRPMEEEWEFFEKLSKGYKTQASVDRNNNHTSSANFVSNQHGTNYEINELSKKVDILLRNLGKVVPNVSQVSHDVCSMFGDPSHSVNNCQNWGVPSNEELAEEVHKREAGKLSSYPTFNPKHKPCGPEHVNMVTSLRNGKTYNNDIKIPSVHDFSHDVEDFLIDDEIVVEGKKADNVKSDSELVNDLLKDFPKPLTQNPKATESPKVGEGGVFLKDLCTQKRKLKATLPKKIDLTENVSAVLSSFLPPKFKDPGAPLISVVVGNIAIKKAFLDLGASINILPASLVDNLNKLDKILKGSTKCDLGTLRKTDTIISLADRSTKILRGILEDVTVKVDDFYYPVDFFIMDTESPYKDVQPTIILRRPFLATIYARINCRTSPMDIVFGNKKLRLNVFNSVNSPTMNECYQVDVIDEEVQKHAPHMLKDDHLDLYLTGENDEILDVAEPLPANFDTATKPSLEVHPTLELKHLPANLKYAFLGPNNSLPVIVASDLFGSQEEALLKVLSKYKAAVGWTIADLKGISPSVRPFIAH
ncbi:putative nucleotidyltransferase, ribonuclease H [Tanacetum coccineum]